MYEDMNKIKITKAELDHLKKEFSEWFHNQMFNKDVNPFCLWRDVLRGSQKTLWFKYLEQACHKKDTVIWESKYEEDGNTILLPDWLEVEDEQGKKKAR